MKSETQFRELTYRCKCGAEDVAKLFLNEPPPAVLNCHKCGAGRGKGVPEMLAQRQGMFPQVAAAIH